MSRLDRQIDRLSGEKLIRIDWPEDASVDLASLRRRLVREIDDHSHRIPLDLRGVKGAPPELVELLVDMRRYALSQSKILSTTWILPPLRQALEDGLHRPVGTRAKPSRDPDAEDASELARELLNGVERQQHYDLSKAQRIERRRRRKRHVRAGKRTSVRLAGMILAGTVVLAGVEVYWLWQQDEAEIVVIPEKGFERNASPQQIPKPLVQQ
jgi:hypothetical protein